MTTEANLRPGKERKLHSSREMHPELWELTGRALLSDPIVQKVSKYVSDWDPFVVNKNPNVLQGSKGIQINPMTGEIALPYSFIIPSKQGEENQWGHQLFYWDVYFINKGLHLTGNPEYRELAKNHIENFQFLFDRLGYIPNASQESILNRTQLPFLTSMIIDIYQVTKDKQWLAEKIELAKKEYNQVWMRDEESSKELGIKRPMHRIDKDSTILRLAGTDVLTEHYPAAAMSAFDDSAQWARRAYDYAPISLNTTLYKYETDFALAAKELGAVEESVKWQQTSEKRRHEINQRFWNEKKGMYFDLRFNKKTNQWEQDSNYYGLTSYMPLWANIASAHQADKLTKNLHKFESPYGLFIASKDSMPSKKMTEARNTIAHGFSQRTRRYLDTLNDIFMPQQWDYPNIWAPIEYFVFDGLLTYGKRKEAQKVMESVMRAATSFYEDKGTLSEKINGLTGHNGNNYHYNNQEGFGFHNAVVALAINDLDFMLKSENVFSTRRATIAS